MSHQNCLSRAVITLAAASFSMVANATDKELDHMFPERLDGKVKHSFVLEDLGTETERDRLVELIVSTHTETDSCNRVSLGAQVARKSLKGWGLTLDTK